MAPEKGFHWVIMAYRISSRNVDFEHCVMTKYEFNYALLCFSDHFVIPSWSRFKDAPEGGFIYSKRIENMITTTISKCLKLETSLCDTRYGH